MQHESCFYKSKVAANPKQTIRTPFSAGKLKFNINTDDNNRQDFCFSNFCNQPNRNQRSPSTRGLVSTCSGVGSIKSKMGFRSDVRHLVASGSPGYIVGQRIKICFESISSKTYLSNAFFRVHFEILMLLLILM